HDDRHARVARRHHQAPGQAHAGAVEAGVGDVQCDASTGDAVEGDAAAPAIEVHALAVVASGPAERARPGVSGTPRELAGGAVQATPAQMVVVARADIDLAAIVEAIAADPAVIAAIPCPR